MANFIVKGFKKQDLRVLAQELGAEIEEDLITIRILDAIVKCPLYSEDCARELLQEIIDDRKEQERREEEKRKRERELELKEWKFELEKLKLDLAVKPDAYEEARSEDLRTREASDGFGSVRPIADQHKGRDDTDQKVLSPYREQDYEQRSPFEETPICLPLAEVKLECTLVQNVTKTAVIRDSLDREKGDETRKLEKCPVEDEAVASEPLILSDDFVLPVIEPEDSRVDLVGMSPDEVLTEQRKSEDLKPLVEEAKIETIAKAKHMTDVGMLVYKGEDKDGSERRLIVVPEKFRDELKRKSHEGTADHPGVTTTKDAKEKDVEILSLQFSREEDAISDLKRGIEGNHLTEIQGLQLRELLTKCTRTFSDVPLDCTSLANHDIELEPVDERVPPLVVIVKLWARSHDINDAKTNSLSSYSLVLMVIHFLQYRCRPPVLPCIQELEPDKYNPHNDVRNLKLHEDLPNFISDNNQNLGELFLGFLQYFSREFNFEKDAISVRLGTVVPREVLLQATSPKNNNQKFVCIEEPFSLLNTALSVFNEKVFRRIRTAFMKSWTDLNRTRNLFSVLKVP